jgi:Fanconi anemia group M protein
MIGPQMARTLLKTFGSIKNIVNADEKDLLKIDKMGKKKVEKVKEVLNKLYEEAENSAKRV